MSGPRTVVQWLSVFQPFSCSGTFHKCLRCSWNPMRLSKCLYRIEPWLRISSQAISAKHLAAARGILRFRGTSVETHCNSLCGPRTKKVGDPWTPDVCIFARFKVNREVMRLRSFANFELVMMSRRGNKLRRALGHGLCVNPSLFSWHPAQNQTMKQM